MKQEIEQLLHERAIAVKAKDIEKAVSFYQNGLRVFDLVDPLERQGKSGLAERLSQWVSSFKEIQDYSFSDRAVQVSGTLAICSFFSHVKALKPDQTPLDMWWRETLGLEKIDDQWLILHTHSSVPFNPESGKASMGLQP